MTLSQAERLNAALAERYQIERELGAGGMATVFLAADLRHDRKVAIKVLKPELAAVLGADRFVVEIKTTASLSHPHILPLFDSGTADGFLFYVMPYIQGETIRQKLDRESQFGVDEAVRIAREVADALDYAHRHGVIHRDIKPENLLLHDGRAMVMDFGIALAVSAAAGGRMTETGLSLGTPHYMSPEQATAEKELSGRSDIYSLGSVLFEMLAGQPPHVGGTAQQVIMKIITEEAPPLTKLRKSVPEHVSAAVMHSLEKLPADRFATAREFSDALANPAFATGLLPSRSTVVRRPRMDWRAGAVAGLLIGALGTWMAVPRAGLHSPGSEARAQLTFNGYSSAPATSADGRQVAYTEQRCPRGTRYPCRFSLVTMERGGNRPITVLDSAQVIFGHRFSRDGQLLFVNAILDASRNGVFVLPRLGGIPRRLSDISSFDLGANGDTVVVAPFGGSGPFAHLILTASGAVVDSVPLPPVEVSAVAWSPDGRHLALVSTYSRITLVARDGTVTDSLVGPFRPNLRWTPDGKGLVLFRALEGNEDDLDFYPVNREGRLGTREVLLPKVPTFQAGEFDVAWNSGTLVLSTGQGTMDLWTFDLAGNAQQRTFGTTWYGDPAISPDGTTLYYQRGDMIGDNLYRMVLPDREESLTSDSVPSGARTVSVSRDGLRVSFGQMVNGATRHAMLDLASRRVTYGPNHGDFAGATVTAHGLVYGRADRRGLLVVDSIGGPARALTFPDSMWGLGIAAGPEGSGVVVLLGERGGRVLATTPLDRMELRELHRFTPDAFVDLPSWGDDGWISFGLARGDEAPALWGVRANGGPLVRRAALPSRCNQRAQSLAASAAAGVCLAVDRRSDIWRVELARLRR
ncbi:MAG: protein kinase [Gemmatimonadota bacterium]